MSTLVALGSSTDTSLVAAWLLMASILQAIVLSQSSLDAHFGACAVQYLGMQPATAGCDSHWMQILHLLIAYKLSWLDAFSDFEILALSTLASVAAGHLFDDALTNANPLSAIVLGMALSLILISILVPLIKTQMQKYLCITDVGNLQYSILAISACLLSVISCIEAISLILTNIEPVWL